MNRNIHYIYSIALLLLTEVATPAFAQIIKGNVYGGGNLSQVVGSTTIHIKSGSIFEEGSSEKGNIYGGGYGASAVLTGNTTINVVGGIVTKDVYGGGALANVTGSTEVNIKGGTVTQDVYGGGALANVVKDLEHELLGNTTVNLTGGTIRHSYGGGLGSISGQNGATETVAAIVQGDATTTLNGSIVLGNVFGCNNLNGTPQGHAKVHVLSTAERDGQGAEEYDVAAVYGGGNLAAYEPTNADDYAEVLIENCDNSIEYVYGGGNAAPVPATEVTIKGANAIDNAFAGGNGAGDGNPGADIGYKGFFSSGAATEYGTGIATINIQGGTIHHVYGGSNTLGYIKDHAEVNVEAEGDCTMDVAELYGGGKKAPGKAAQINITCTGEEGKIDNVYGGAHMADLTGDITLNINGGNIGNAFGGNNESGTIDGTITVNVNWDTDACSTNSLDNVYGGGNKAAYTGNPAVNILNGMVNENVFGGGLEAIVTGDPTVTVNGGTVTLGAYGGGALADVNGNTSVNIISGTVGNAYGGGLGSAEVAAKVVNTSVQVTGGTVDNVFGCNNTNGSPTGTVNVEIAGGTVSNNVYGGGNLANAGTTENHVNPVVTVRGGTVTHDVYGGGALADVIGNTTVTLLGGTINGDAYGGGLGQLADAVAGKEAIVAHVIGNTQVNLGDMVDDGEGNLTPTGDATVSNIFGCNNLNGGPNGTATVNVISGIVNHNVYGGGNLADATVTPQVTVSGGRVSEEVFGGGYGTTAIITGNPTVSVTGGTVARDVYGGGALANVSGATTVLISGGQSGDVYGGGLGQLADAGAGKEAVIATVGNSSVRVTGGTANNVFGCNNTNGSPTGNVNVEIAGGTVNDNVYGGGNLAAATVNPQVTINGGSIANDVFGGGYGTTAVITGSPVVTVSDGTVTGAVYGGGALANVIGSTTVNLEGGAVDSAYGGALGAKTGVDGATEDVAAIVTGNTTVTLGKDNGGGTFSASQVTGEGIFGANNINGTPEGHVKVHVLKTTPREGQISGQFDVAAVYGGGNKAAYVPTNANDYAEVLIENCDNSIEDVYGGGNAAPVPATKVTILGANFIQNAFAGGNGKGQHDDPSAANYNPGADIGYLNYLREEANKYGTGKASIEVYGGTVVNVYGGSNTWGFIRSGSDVKVQEDLAKTLCKLDVTSIFGGGNEADIDGDVNMVVDCSQGVKTLFAGASNADVNGNITLTIQSGTYENVFAGNNFGGRVNGSITLNVEEVGCQPVIIRDLYCCGNQAAYSIYGYGEAKDDGSGYRRYALLESAPEGKEPYNSPVLNIISCTRIDNVYGGGLGEPATVVGNPTVNINMVQGAFASQRTFVPAYIIDNEGKRVSNTTVTVGDILPASGLGVIGNVFGGGNAAEVKGNTSVNIATIEHALHADGAEILIDDAVVAPSANITGNVYGGGNVANVTGQTNVKIGKDK